MYTMYRYNVSSLLLAVFSVSAMTGQEQTVGLRTCPANAAPCTCMKANSLIIKARAHHGAPLTAVSWCCQSLVDSLGWPSIHLAAAGVPVYDSATQSQVVVRLYELDLHTRNFYELNATNINMMLPGVPGTEPAVLSLDWCCTENMQFLIVGGSNLASFTNPITQQTEIADVAVFAFDANSWQVPVGTAVPYAVGHTGYYYYQYGAPVYAVSALCQPCPAGSSVQFYLLIGGQTPGQGVTKQATLIPFVLESLVGGG